MLPRNWSLPLLGTVLAIVLISVSCSISWYEVEIDQDSGDMYLWLWTRSDYPSTDSGHYGEYSSGAQGSLMDMITGLVITWIIAGLLFVWICLRQSRKWGMVLGLVLVFASVAAALYFPLAIADAIRSDTYGLVPVNSFIGQSTDEYGTVYEYGPGVGWFLCVIAAALQIVCVFQLVMPAFTSRKENKEPKSGEQA